MGKYKARGPDVDTCIMTYGQTSWIFTFYRVGLNNFSYLVINGKMRAIDRKRHAAIISYTHDRVNYSGNFFCKKL